MSKGADLSDCGRYRYRLWRIWGSQPLLGWIMLNPSTADADLDDPTIRKCMGFSERLGYGGIMVTNLFAFRATKPADLKSAENPVGPGNDEFLRQEARACPKTICAWGTKGTLEGRAQAVLRMLSGAGVSDKLHCLKVSKDGHPCHPLYLPYDRTPQPLEKV